MADVFIEDLETVTRDNPYAPLVKQLEDAEATRKAAAEKAGIPYPSEKAPAPQARLVFPTEKEATLALSKIQAAAIDANRSARKVGDIENTAEAGSNAEEWTLRVKLGERRTRRSSEEVAAEKAAREAEKAAKAPAAEPVAA